MILSTKLKNSIVKANPNGDYEIRLKNIIINGAKRGCSGFIVNRENNTIVYVTTEPCMNLGYMYRYADSTSDYRGYHNHWSRTYEGFVTDVIGALKRGNIEKR